VFNLLLQPYPNKWVNPKRWQTEILLGLVVVLVLLAFNPSFLKSYTLFNRVLIASMHGSVCVLSLFCLRRVSLFLFPEISENEFWTGSKVLLINALDLLFIGTVNYLLAAVFGKITLSWQSFVFFESQIMMLGFLQLTFWDILFQVLLSEKHHERAQFLNHQLRELPPNLVFSNTKIPSNNPLTAQFAIIRAENPTDNFKLWLEKGLFIQTEGAFVRISYLENKQVKHVLIRTNLRKVMEDLQNAPQYCRCHINYLVNMNKIMSITGNAQGYQLELESVCQFIPVTYTKEIARRTNITTSIRSLDLVAES
jgi:DNA-binding LytR/AlgR family response regulator